MPGRAPRRAVVLVVVLAISLVSADAQARIVVLGHSVEGRAIKADVIGPNSARRKILLVGCIHGNECAGRGILTAVARLRALKGVQLWLVKEMNPDGTAADTRQNAHGVDLNRNSRISGSGSRTQRITRVRTRPRNPRPAWRRR